MWGLRGTGSEKAEGGGGSARWGGWGVGGGAPEHGRYGQSRPTSLLISRALPSAALPCLAPPSGLSNNETVVHLHEGGPCGPEVNRQPPALNGRSFVR